MTGVAVFAVGIAAAVILACWAAIDAPRWARAGYARLTRPHPGAHERPGRRVHPRTVPPPGDRDQRAALYATLGLPAPGLDMYSDHDVWLPCTPSSTPGLPELPGAFDQQLRSGVSLARKSPESGRPGATERLATDTDVRAHIVPDVAENLCHCGKPAGHLAAALAGDHPERAFDTDTAQFEVIR